MDNNQLVQVAAETFCLVPEIYQQAFQQAGANFPDELVQQIKERPEDAMKMLQNDEALLKGVVSIYEKNSDAINQAVQSVKSQGGLFKEGGKLAYGLQKFQVGGRFAEPIKGNWNDYHTIIKAPGDTLRFKQYPYHTEEMQTYPNGNIRYTSSHRNEVNTSWSPSSKPSFMQRLIWGKKKATPETIENWNQLIFNHRNDSNVKDTSR